MGTVDRRERTCLDLILFSVIRIPDRKNRCIGSMFEYMLLTTSLLACGIYRRYAHIHIANIYVLFFWQRSHLMAEVGIASLSALCSLPHLIVPGSITSPSYMYNLKGITYYFNYLSLIN